MGEGRSAIPRFGTSQGGVRVEDARLVAGRGRFVDDIRLPGELVGHVVRSPHAHARILAVDAARARTMPGVAAVITGADLAAAGVEPIPSIVALANRDGTPRAAPPHRVLATDRARHVGDGIAFVVAATPEAALDAAETVRVDYEPLPAVSDGAAALRPGAPLVHDDVPGNLVFDWERGEAVASASDAAAHVVRLDLVNTRVAAAPLETRSALARFDAASGRLTLWTGTQGVWLIRDSLARHVLKVPPERVRVITPDVGGAFGSKIVFYPEHALVAWAAKCLGRPVRWTAERTESFVADAQGRDQRTRAALALDEGGRILALRVETVANLGAYLSTYAPLIPTSGTFRVMPGVYQVPRLHYRVRGVLTNTPPVDAYRGAGRPEAIYIIERLIDAAARRLGLDAAEIRRRNFIAPAAMPFTTATGETYDSGEFERVMEQALDRAGRAGFAARRAEARRRGAHRGFGICCYVEDTRGSGREHAAIRFAADGGIDVLVGTQSTGQGHETAFARLVHRHLGVPIALVRVLQGDSVAIPAGGGTAASRSLIAGGWALAEAAARAIERGRALAAETMEASAADIEFGDGTFRVVGTDRAIGILDLARQAREKISSGTGSRRGLDAEAEISLAGASYPNGCHVAEVEIDGETGAVAVVRYTVIDDFGRVLNPDLVAGQVQGGVAQGIGQALLEHAAFDKEGQPLAASFTTYALPRAADVPAIDLATHEVPCRTNPLGVKGCGEAGLVAAPAAVVTAVLDALSDAGVTALDMPLTPEKIWRALRNPTAK